MNRTNTQYLNNILINQSYQLAYAFLVFLRVGNRFLRVGNRLGSMCGLTPPSLIIVLPNNLFSSPSFLIANKIYLGTILLFLLSLAAIPANSNISAVKYSKTAAIQTGAPAPTLSLYLPAFKRLAILPTGNYNPALVDLEVYFYPPVIPLAFPFPTGAIYILYFIFYQPYFLTSNISLISLLAN